MSDELRYRSPGEVAALWPLATSSPIDPKLLAAEEKGPFWDLLGSLGVTLLVTREYEHLALSLSFSGDSPRAGVFSLPHPSGIAVDPTTRQVHIASTRNPNVVFELAAVECEGRGSEDSDGRLGATLAPTSARFFPGRGYLHDLAWIDGHLFASATGLNAVVSIEAGGTLRPEWWPVCIETEEGPVFERNCIQLNSIGPGGSLADSVFAASACEIGPVLPGDPDFAVDGRGVIFSGRTREPIARGLTRPHSVRQSHGRIWVDNSGYGEVGFIDAETLCVVARLPGWTRGLCLLEDVLFVGTSRVLPRFERYAPGLDPAQCCCGIHAVSRESGAVIASLTWPEGNQIFAVEAVPRRWTAGFSRAVGDPGASEKEHKLFYSFVMPGDG